jgi:hypothetical protein
MMQRPIVNTSREAVELLASSYSDTDVSPTLLVLLQERDAARAELSDVLAENDALRFVLNTMRAEIDALRARLTVMEGRSDSPAAEPTQ